MTTTSSRAASTVLSLALFAVSGAASAETFKECLDRKKNEVKQTQDFTSEEMGCSTESTTVDFGGIKHKVCDLTVCYRAPTGYVIVGEAKALDWSATGSEHWITAVSYLSNTFGQVEAVCTNVHARSPGVTEGRGWQNIKFTGKTQRVLSEDLLSAIAESCAAGN